MAELLRIVIVGGGAAGYFAAIACAESLGDRGSVTLYEATAHPLAKVRISGGGRCNVTHACFEPRELAQRYPRGGRELVGAFHRFQPRDTIAWFAERGVELKTEPDGRMFPVTDDSATIVDCLRQAAERAGVKLVTSLGVRKVEAIGASRRATTEPADRRRDSAVALRMPGSEGEAAGATELPSHGRDPASAGGSGGPAARATTGFWLTLTDDSNVRCEKLLIATGGNKASAGFAIGQALGHTIVPPVPSLFTFHIDDKRLEGLSGVSMENAAVAVRGSRLKESGPLLITHWGLSGPAVLKLSAWGARELAERRYEFPLVVNFAPPHTRDSLVHELTGVRGRNARKQVGTWSPLPFPQRLWERLVSMAGIDPATPWAQLSNTGLGRLAAAIVAAEFTVVGKSLFKDEFVTCGGVRLSEVDFRTMESRICPGLHFAGEVLDIDGVTGGFNFQAAWTTGWLAGRAMAADRPSP